MRTLVCFLVMWLAATTANAEEYQLLLFTAKWCGHCKPMAKRLRDEQMTAALRKINAVSIEINVDDYPELRDSYGIKAVPTLILVRLDAERKGVVINKETGKLDMPDMLKVATVLTEQPKPAQNPVTQPGQ